MDYGTPKCRKVISNLVRVNDPLPITQTRMYGTIEADQDTVIIKIMENTEETWIVEPEKYTDENEIGTITLTLPPGLPKSAPIEVKFEMNIQGRLHITGREPHSNIVINVMLETKSVMDTYRREQAKERAKHLKIL
jgi:molecular chaperone DnaK (HSP70)